MTYCTEHFGTSGLTSSVRSGSQTAGRSISPTHATHISHSPRMQCAVTAKQLQRDKQQVSTGVALYLLAGTLHLTHHYLTRASQTRSSGAKWRWTVWLAAGSIHKLRTTAHEEVLSIWLAQVSALFLSCLWETKERMCRSWLWPACFHTFLWAHLVWILQQGSTCRRRRS